MTQHPPQSIITLFQTPQSSKWGRRSSSAVLSTPAAAAFFATILMIAPCVSAFVGLPRQVMPPSPSTIVSSSSSDNYLSSINVQKQNGEISSSATTSRVDDTRKTKTKKRTLAFSRSAYPLEKDEERLQYKFISFIDHSIGSSYSQVARLIEPRSYAREDQFHKDMAEVPPTINDVAPPPSRYGPVATFLAWNKLPARTIVGAMAYFSFPVIIQFLEKATQNVEDEALATLVGTFLPGVSIVLGTYFSLTLSILYDRFTRLQQAVSLEAGLLALTCHNLLDLFANDDDKDAAVEGVQCIADQIRTLVRENRGREIMGVIYSDPYARILRLVKERNADGDLDSELVAEVRTAVGDLFQLRSKRMSDEALALAPTHFDVMTFLSGLLLVGFALGTVATAQTDGMPAGIARILFSALVVCYVIFYEMSFDLNRPFDGVYQLRISGAAMHFLQVKHLVSNHPVVRGLIDFEEVTYDEEELGVLGECDADCKRTKAKTWYN